MAIKMEVVIPVGEFNAALWKRFHEGKIRNVYPKSKYYDILNKIKSMRESPPRNSPELYYLLRKFIVVKVGHQERLASKSDPGFSGNGNSDINPKFKFYVALEEIYECIDHVHKITKHGGRDKIVRTLQQQGIVNVTRDTVELYLSFCRICRPRRKELSKRFCQKVTSTNLAQSDAQDDVVNVVDLSSDADQNNMFMQSNFKTEVHMEDTQQTGDPYDMHFICGYVNVLDFSTTRDGEYNFVFVYQDCETAFCVLRPLRCKCTYEIVTNLLDVFTLIGPPQILYSDCDIQFLSSVIQELKSSWPGCIIVSGCEKFQDVELKISSDKCLAEIQEMLRAWMADNNSSRWSLGIKFTQLRKNTQVTGCNEKSAYETFFNRSVHTNLPPNVNADVLSKVEKEEELRQLISCISNSEPEEFEQLQVSLDPNICSLVQNGTVPCETQNQVLECTGIKIEVPDDTDDAQDDSLLSVKETYSVASIRRTEISVKHEPDDTC